VNGVRLPTADDDNGSDEDSEAADDGAPHDNETARAARITADEDAAAATSSTSPPSSPVRSRLRRSGGGSGGIFSTTSDSDGDIGTPHLLSDAPHPPSSSPSPDRDEAAIELDALLEAEAALSNHNATSTGHAWKGTPNSGADAIAMDEDEDLWDTLHPDLDTGAVASAPTTAMAPAPPAVDDDQEMWDIMHELEQEKAKETAHPPDPPAQVPPAAASDTQPETDDLDDLYL
jgi:hypothetical protein